VLKLIGATQTFKHLNGQPETKHLRHLKPGAADIPKVFSAGSSGSPHKSRSRSSSRGRTKNNSRSRSHSSNSSCSSSSSRSRVSSCSSEEEVLGEQLQDLHIKTVKAEAVKAVQLHFASHQSTAAILGERLKAAEDQTEVQKQKICEQEKEIRTLQKRVATADADLRQLNQFLTAPRSIEAYPLSPTGIDALTDTAPPGTPDQLASSKKRTRDLTEQ
jgi:cell division protein FtsB